MRRQDRKLTKCANRGRPLDRSFVSDAGRRDEPELKRIRHRSVGSR
jgi:hypothetical protein